MTTYSIIIPYQHLPERESLFYACLENLLRLCRGFEICIHEVGPSPHLNVPRRCKYLFTKFNGVFHRAWAINRGVKELATGDILILMDGDLIITRKWVDEVLNCDPPSAAWGRINWLSEEGTRKYLKTRSIDDGSIERTRTPSRGGAAGAATAIRRDLFFNVSGIPEDFAGSWGGEDNAFWAKLSQLDYKFKSFKCTITHLYHPKSTPQVRSIQKKVLPMLYWTRSQWKEYVRMVGSDWGLENPDIVIKPSFNYISTIRDARLTIAMLSWLRFDKLINTLTSHLETITIPVNLVLMIQGSENLNKKQKRRVKDLANQFSMSDVFFTKGNIGTGPARKALLSRTLRRFQTEYINLADDDTTYTDGSVEEILRILDEDPSIGVAGIRYKGNVYKLDSVFNPTTFRITEAEHPVEVVDSTGSASAFIRRDVFNLCRIDPTYIIGEWDIDLFMQARAVGWKMVNVQTFPEMGAVNDYGGPPEYKKARLNRKEIKNSVNYFKQKWGLDRAL